MQHFRCKLVLHVDAASLQLCYHISHILQTSSGSEVVCLHYIVYQPLCCTLSWSLS